MTLRTASRSQYLAADGFLRTRDNPVSADLLPTPDDSNPAVSSIRFVENRHGLVLMQLDNVLSSQECEQIVGLNDPSSFVSMKGRYEESKRRGSRLLAIDEKLSTLIWDRIQDMITTTVDQAGLSTTPLGFGVSTGSWSLDGTNSALRINLFTEKDGLFAPHVDAQYCPHADRRSLLSVVVYLTDDFDGGETKFYFPKDPTTLENVSSLKGLTVDEEMQHLGGLQNGYDCVSVKPRRGSAVVFSQNLLHEGTPLTPKVANDGVNPLRAILRMDVMVRREKEWKGFVISEAETEDYQACLTYFREAQTQELKGNAAKAGELYERSLSIRYSYPKVLALSKNVKKLPCRLNRLPSELLPRIGLFLKEVDIQKIVLAFPSLLWLLEAYQLSHKNLRRTEESKDLSSIEWLEIPEWRTHYGPCSMLRFPSAEFFKNNIEGCCRVAAVIAFFRLGHTNDSDVYTVSYNPVTQEAVAVDMKDVLLSVFHQTPCFGALFKVKQQDAAKRNPQGDFHASVDRTYMTYRFGSQFVGEGYLDNFYNRVTHPSKSEADDEEFDLVKDTEDHDSDMDDGDERDFSDSYQMPPQSNVGGSSRKVNDYDNDFARKAFARLPYFLSEYEMKRSTSHSLQDPTSYLQSVTSLNSGKREFCRIGEVHHLMQACHCQRRTLVFYPHEPMDDDSVFLEYEDCPNDGVAGIWNLDDESPLSRNANDMVFDFSRYQLAVTEEASFEKSKPESCRACRVHEHDGAEGYLWKKFVNAPDAARWGVRMKDPERKMMRFKVDVTPLQQSDRFESFNHASHQCFFSPHLKVEMMDCLTYTHLDHVHLRCSEDLNGGYLVYASYTGIVAM